MAKSLHMVLDKKSTALEGLWGHTLVGSNCLTAGSGPRNHETFTLFAPAELTEHLHSAHSAPTGHKPTHYGNFKTPKEGKLHCTIGRQQKENPNTRLSPTFSNNTGRSNLCLPEQVSQTMLSLLLNSGSCCNPC